MRPKVRSTRYVRQPGMDGAAHGALIKTSTTGPQEQRWAAGSRRHDRPTRPPPGTYRLDGGQPERNGALFVALAEHPQEVSRIVDVVEVKTDQFADPDAGGIEHFECCIV